jgi:hypothetical protein
VEHVDILFRSIHIDLERATEQPVGDLGRMSLGDGYAVSDLIPAGCPPAHGLRGNPYSLLLPLVRCDVFEDCGVAKAWWIRRVPRITRRGVRCARQIKDE